MACLKVCFSRPEMAILHCEGLYLPRRALTCCCRAFLQVTLDVPLSLNKIDLLTPAQPTKKLVGVMLGCCTAQRAVPVVFLSKHT